jgi:ring-1,2-phenylacetyl-CoA epoxidase subunit PaaE
VDTASAPTRGFHRLRVARVDPLTDDAAALTFDVPEELREHFAFSPGQSLTVRRAGHGTDERRSYSICSAAGTLPRIGVRAVEGGAVSGWLVREVAAGDVLEVQPPAGAFTPDLAVPGEHVLLAAGSGITPVLSIAASLLAANDENVVTLIYGNRRSDTAMFVDEIADLKDAHPTRMRVFHVLSREPQEVELFCGRLDAAKLRDLLPVAVDPDWVDHWWLCGPFGLVADAITVLDELGVESARIHRELFFVGEQPSEVHHVDAPDGSGASVTVVMDGRRFTTEIPAGTTVLDGAQRVRPDLPFACKGGVCGTCRARVTDGEVRMRRNFALDPNEVAAGYVLTCQSDVVTDAATIDFDT